MRRLDRGLLVAVLLAFIVLLVWFSTQQGTGASTWARGPRGLSLAYDYLDARDVPVARWDRSLTELGTLGESSGIDSLVIALPLDKPLLEEEGAALDSWIVEGGTLVLLGSGRRVSPADRAWLRGLGVEARPHGGDAPLWWFDWSAWWSREEQLVAEPGSPSDMPLLTVRTGTTVLLPLVSSDKAVLQRFEAHETVEVEGPRQGTVSARGAPAVFTMARGGGQLLVVNNGSALGHMLLDSGSNLGFLDALAHGLTSSGGTLFFDEVHHGYGQVDAYPTPATDAAFWGVVGKLMLMWALVAWMVSRPFGPRVEVIRARSGAVARELRALASLHRAGGHAHDAGRRLLQLAHTRARRSGKGIGDLPAVFEGGEAELLGLAQELGRRRKKQRR